MGQGDVYGGKWSGSKAVYLHGYSVEEQRRLYRQATVLAPVIFEGADLSGACKLLEIGCGVGSQTKLMLAKWPQLEISSIDLSPSHLARARAHLHAETAVGRVSLSPMNGEEMDFPDNCFEAAVVIWVLEHTLHPEKILAEAFRVLRPGGKLIVVEVDNSTFRFSPEREIVHGWCNRFNECQKAGGGDPFIGQRLPRLLRNAGFREEASRELVLASSTRLDRRKQELHWLRDLLLSASR